MKKVLSIVFLFVLFIPAVVLAKVPNEDNIYNMITPIENPENEDIAVVLDSLTVSECDSCKLSPSFKSNITFYMVSTKSDEIKISATANKELTITGTGVKTLTKDSETFEIVVESSSGDTNTYKIKVTKEKKSDTTLKSLTIDNGNLNPKFSSDVTSYSATVDSDKVVISAVANDSKAKVEGAGEKQLKYGKNTFNIVVTGEDGTTKSYLLNITRPDNNEINAYLKSITIDGEDIGFDKDIFEYVYNVSNDITELDIEAVPELDSSTVEIIGNEEFVIGENVITIKVVAEDDSEKIYTITVIKEEEIEEPELDGIYLSKLEIKGHDIEFQQDKLEYVITIKDEKKLDIIAETNNENYIIEITGNENLQDGSIIKIIVTDENDESNIYKIKIKVDNTIEKEESKELNYIPIIMISLLVILAVVDIMFVIKRIKAKDE